ncbi:MAG TPA: hypothetical protein VE641_03595 [Chthoniobacterales bacterium]|nr:hypothetical protein [Chthoniobacterales bacterium]
MASVFRLGMSGSEYFYATEFVEGETLESADFKTDPIWDPIRKDPRFDQLAEQLPQYP